MEPVETRIDRRVAIGGGVFFGLGLGGVVLANSGGLIWPAVAVAAGSGVVFSFALSRGLRRQRRSDRVELDGRSVDLSDTRDAIDGPPAPDRAGRERQLRIVDQRLAQARRSGRRASIVFAVLLVLDVVLAVTSSPWFWLAAVLFFLLLAASPLPFVRLQRRRDELAGTAPVEPTVDPAADP